MPLPAPLLRRKLHVHKNTFGHVLVLAGSRHMVGAAALTALSAMRSGAGLVTLGIPKSLNSVVQKKISAVVMTLSLSETSEQTIAMAAYSQIQKKLSSFDVIALGPGLSTNKSTQQFIRKTIGQASKPLVIDADGLRAISTNLSILKKNKETKILTPHPGEMSFLTGLKKSYIENNRNAVARKFAKQHNCILLLKGHNTLVASASGRTYINKTGNPGMATAGSGDVLTGMIAAFLAQGLSGFDATKYAAYFHGRAGDLAARKRSRLSMIATDIIDNIPEALQIR